MLQYRLGRLACAAPSLRTAVPALPTSRDAQIPLGPRMQGVELLREFNTHVRLRVELTRNVKGLPQQPVNLVADSMTCGAARRTSSSKAAEQFNSAASMAASNRARSSGSFSARRARAAKPAASVTVDVYRTCIASFRSSQRVSRTRRCRTRSIAVAATYDVPAPGRTGVPTHRGAADRWAARTGRSPGQATTPFRRRALFGECQSAVSVAHFEPQMKALRIGTTPAGGWRGPSGGPAPGGSSRAHSAVTGGATAESVVAGHGPHTSQCKDARDRAATSSTSRNPTHVPPPSGCGRRVTRYGPLRRSVTDHAGTAFDAPNRLRAWARAPHSSISTGRSSPRRALWHSLDRSTATAC